MILSTHGIIQSEAGVSFVGLLDTYPNAAAAYSLRKLRSAYTGSAIQVRRSSDNTTQDIGFTGANVLDTSALTTFCSGTNGFVTTWYDQSGNGINATQSTALNQPQIVSSGTYLGYLQNSTTGVEPVLKSPFSYTSGQGFSAFFTVQNFGGTVFGGTEDGGVFYAVADAGSGSSSSSGFTVSNYYKNGTSIGTTRNDISVATTSFSLLTTLASCNSVKSFWLGYGAASFFNNQRMKEIIIYNNQTVSRTGVESNTISYYGL